MQASFEEQGYLSAREWEGHVIDPVAINYLSITKKVNALAHNFAATLSVNTSDPQQLFSVCLFLRLLESAQAVVILSCMGLRQDAAALLRVALEALFKLRSCCKDRTFLRGYASQSAKEDKKRLRLGIPHKSRSELAENLRRRLEQVEEEVNAVLSSNQGEWPNLPLIAQSVGMEDLYHGAYRLFSASVHAEFGSLGDYIDMAANPRLVYGPRMDYAALYMGISSEFILAAMEAIADVLEQAPPADIAVLRSEIEGGGVTWPGSSGQA